MSKLKELEKRLQQEPGNLGLRIMLATAYRDVARLNEAVDLYRSVAIAYRDQGRIQQAVAVCKSVLELAPNDVASKALLAALIPPAAPSPSVPPMAATVAQPDPKSQMREGEVEADLDVGTLVAAPVIPARPAIQIPTQPMIAVQGPRPSSPSTPPTPTPPMRPMASPTRPPPAITPPTPTPALIPIPPFRTSSPLRGEGSAPFRRSSGDETPLPRAVPHHVHDPTTANIRKLSSKDLITNEHGTPNPEPTDTGDTIPGGRPSEQTPLTRPSDTQPRLVTRPSDTQPRMVTLPGDTQTRKRTPSVAGIANAARRISTSLMGNHERSDIDIAQELDTRQRPKVDSEQLAHLAAPPPTTAPFRRNDLDDDEEGIITPVPLEHRDDERTNIRELSPAPARLPPPALPILGTQFFAPLPADKRAAVLGRFQKKLVSASTTVIRQGEIAHPLVLVAKGRLDVRAERADGRMVQVGTIALGEYVGEVALLHRVPAAAHVIAAGDVELLLLPPRDFYELAGAFPALWAELKDVAERRQREYDFRMKSSR